MMKKTILLTLALVAGSGAIFGLSANNGTAVLVPKLDVDKSPPLRTGPTGGYADVVAKVSPSVVSIFTTREMAPMDHPSMRELPDLFESPLFRDFFGYPQPGRPEKPRRSPRSLPQQRGLGSGVILSADGYILTNNHVVEKASDIRVRLDNGDEFEAKTIATDPATDLAVIKVPGEGLPAATLGDSENLMPGDTVLAIGSPFGLNQTVTKGIVSATGRDNLNIVGYENFIQTDAAINPGNSGGALIDNRGRVIGINTAIFSRSGGNVGIGFTTPVNMAVSVAEQLIEEGRIERGYLGVTLAPLDRKLAEALGVKNRGALVNEVVADAPAEKAGFKAGDVITSVNGKEVEDVADVRRMVGGRKPGTELEFTVNRGGEEVALRARIDRMPSGLLAGGPPAEPEKIEEGALRGVRLRALEDRDREQLGLSADASGVLVIEVASNSAAAEAGLRPGDVITEINRREVTKPEEAYAESSRSSGRPALVRVTDGRVSRFLAIG